MSPGRPSVRLDTALVAAKEKFGKSDYKGGAGPGGKGPGVVECRRREESGANQDLGQSQRGTSQGRRRDPEPDKLASAKAGLADITKQLATATETFKAGNLTDAVAMATAVKTKAAEVLTILRMPVPDALKG